MANKENKEFNSNKQKHEHQSKTKTEKENVCDCNEKCNCESEKETNVNNNSNDNVNNNANINNVNYLEVAQRIQAEFENYKRRNKDIEKVSYNNGIVNAVRSMLPVIDSFNQAIEGIKDENTLKGLNIIRNQIMSAFTSLGVKPIECVGKKFDPNFHNAVLAVEDSKYESGVVLEEFQQGFMLDDIIIRHSVVKINK